MCFRLILPRFDLVDVVVGEKKDFLEVLKQDTNSQGFPREILRDGILAFATTRNNIRQLAMMTIERFGFGANILKGCKISGLSFVALHNQVDPKA